eukprot:2867938-Prymnesium_polylepis.1
MVKIVENAERLVVEDGRRFAHRTAEHAHREGDFGTSVHGAIEQGTAKALVVPTSGEVPSKERVQRVLIRVRRQNEEVVD